LKQIRVQELINMYRVRGHLNAHLDPLHSEPPALHAELDIANYGLTMWTCSAPSSSTDSRDVARRLWKRSFRFCARPTVARRASNTATSWIPSRTWIQQRVEGVSSSLSVDEQHRVLEALNEAEVFERFLHSRYVGQKRFGLEGGESTIVALRTILDVAADEGTKEVVIGMAHRGRLNVLANVVGKSYNDIFSEFEGNLDPESVQGSGDVKYHKVRAVSSRTPRRHDRRLDGLEPFASRSGLTRRRGHRARQAGPDHSTERPDRSRTGDRALPVSRTLDSCDAAFAVRASSPRPST